MNLNPYFKSIIEQDKCAVVICDLDDTIIYMNQAAVKNYAKWGGEALMGKCLLNCHNPNSVNMIGKVKEWFAADRSHNRIHTGYRESQKKDIYMIALRDEDGSLIGYYEKHEYRTPDAEPFYQFI